VGNQLPNYGIHQITKFQAGWFGARFQAEVGSWAFIFWLFVGGVFRGGGGRDAQNSRGEKLVCDSLDLNQNKLRSSLPSELTLRQAQDDGVFLRLFFGLMDSGNVMWERVWSFDDAGTSPVAQDDRFFYRIFFRGQKLAESCA
jgi:hypothetical protein